MRFKYRYQRPTREQLAGLSPSELKTLIKRRGFKISRDFFKWGCRAQKGSRLYRFRWWADEFVVDVSHPLSEFDRWANSVDKTVLFREWREK
jgi:hypothetical protein